MKREPLKPCLCGCLAILFAPVEGGTGYVIRCCNSLCAERQEDEDIDTVISKWNKRIKNKANSIKLQISKQDNGYVVSADRFPGLSAWGETAEKAMLEFAKVLKLYMEVMIEDEETISTKQRK